MYFERHKIGLHCESSGTWPQAWLLNYKFPNIYITVFIYFSMVYTVIEYVGGLVVCQNLFVCRVSVPTG